jgi:hypothetical protein
MTAASQLNCVPQQSLENWWLWPSSDSWLQKFCARWVPKMNSVEHRTARKSICAGLLQRSEKDGNAFLPRITGEETCVHHYYPLENTINGMASSGVATQEQIQGTDFC